MAHDQVAQRLIGLGEKATTIAAEFAALSRNDQTMLAAPSDATTRDERLVAEVRAVAEAESAVHAANRALSEKKRALAEKSEAVVQAMAKSMQYVPGIMILLTTAQLGAKKRSWCVPRWLAPWARRPRATRALGRARAVAVRMTGPGSSFALTRPSRCAAPDA